MLKLCAVKGHEVRYSFYTSLKLIKCDCISVDCVKSCMYNVIPGATMESYKWYMQTPYRYIKMELKIVQLTHINVE